MAIDAFLRSPAASHSPPAAARTQQAQIVSSFRNARGQLCHVVQQRVRISGERVLATGTVCRQRDGGWVLTR